MWLLASCSFFRHLEVKSWGGGGGNVVHDPVQHSQEDGDFAICRDAQKCSTQEVVMRWVALCDWEELEDGVAVESEVEEPLCAQECDSGVFELRAGNAIFIDEVSFDGLPVHHLGDCGAEVGGE